jgi:hypothetical protein
MGRRGKKFNFGSICKVFARIVSKERLSFQKETKKLIHTRDNFFLGLKKTSAKLFFFFSVRGSVKMRGVEHTWRNVHSVWMTRVRDGDGEVE